MEQREAFRKFKVLLAWDQAGEVNRLVRCLTALGHAVAGVAADGRAACRLHHELRPDLAILAERLPGLNGLEAARRMSVRRPLPVVLLANNGQARPSPGAGPELIAGYLSPPWEPSLVGPALALAWENFHRLRRLEDKVRGLSLSLGERKNIELAKGLLMQRRGLSLLQAQECLHGEARRRGLSLAQAALEVVGRQGNGADKSQAR